MRQWSETFTGSVVNYVGVFCIVDASKMKVKEAQEGKPFQTFNCLYGKDLTGWKI